jgi:hypothetical protein
MPLYLALLRVQTRLTAGALIGVVVAIALGFAMPWLLGALGLAGGDLTPPQLYLQRASYSGAVLLITSLVLGAVAGVAWAEQGSRTRGVYLMTLPLPRVRLLLLEFAVTATLLAGGAVVVYVGGLVAGAMAPIPDGLHAYPFALAVRFFTMSLLVASLLFGPTRLASSPDPRRSSRLAIAAGIAVLAIVFAESLGLRGVSRLLGAMLNVGGPLHVLTGSWQLVDL